MLSKREDLHSAIVEIATDAILAIDEQSVILFANPAAEKTFEYTLGEIVGQPLTILMPADLRALHTNSLRRYVKTGEKHMPWTGVEVRAKKKSGLEFPVEISFGEFHKDSKRFFVGVVRDITERKATEDARRAADEKWQSLVRNAPNTILTIDRSGTIEFLNRALAPYTVEEVTGTSVYEYLPPDEVVAKKMLYAEVFRTGEPQSYEVVGPGAEGGSAYYHVTVGPIRQNEQISSLILIATDITEQKRAEKLQSALYRIAEKTNSADDMQEFYAALHEIIGELMYARNFYIALYNEENDILTFPYFMDEFDDPPAPVAPGKTLTGYVLRKKEPVFLNREMLNVLVQTGEVQQIGARPVDWLGVPLKTKDKIFGVLAIQSYTEEFRYDQKDKDLLTYVSQHIAAALDQKQAEDALRVSEEKYRTLFEESQDPIFFSTIEGKFLDINRAGLELLGYSSRDELRNIDIRKDLFADPSERESYHNEIARNGFVKDFELHLRKRNGEPIRVLETATALHDGGGKIIGYRGTLRDVTRLRELEERVRQGQKMEAVGQLAGGVAHDFNNTLMAISGFSELLLSQTPEDHPHQKYIVEIIKAAEAGARLTRQLLAFSRRQILEPKLVDLNLMLDHMKDILQRLIGEQVRLVFALDPEIQRIKVDPSQLEQVLLNLVVNARDAMPHGGELRIDTSNVVLAQYLGGVQPPGSYVLMQVSDTGSGMDQSTLSRIFEPFFTTKENGKGTGLGLATVYGIVKQNGGFVWASSEVGKGTAFKIYFPPFAEELSRKESMAPHIGLEQRNETILLVDDNNAVRAAISQLLQTKGYRVFSANDAQEALAISDEFQGTIDLLITDVVMPRMSGYELAQILGLRRPGIKILFVSGYDEEAIAGKRNLQPGTAFVQKPATIESILRKLDELQQS